MGNGVVAREIEGMWEGVEVSWAPGHRMVLSYALCQRG
jgi:hypothetical protein